RPVLPSSIPYFLEPHQPPRRAAAVAAFKLLGELPRLWHVGRPRFPCCGGSRVEALCVLLHNSGRQPPLIPSKIHSDSGALHGNFRSSSCVSNVGTGRVKCLRPLHIAPICPV